MGLSFNGTADARAFDRGIRIALENLEKGKYVKSFERSIKLTPHVQILCDY